MEHRKASKASCRDGSCQLVTRCLVLMCLATGAAALAKPSYTLVAPSVLRPNKDFVVIVSTHNTSNPLRVSVEITGNIATSVGNTQPGTGTGSASFESRQEAVIDRDSTAMLKFQMGDLDAGDYHLSIAGSGGGLGSFRNITSLTFNPKSYSVFITTDRSIYSPKEKVKIRAIIVNSNLRPSVTGAIDVSIRDGSGLRVKQFERVFTNRGVWFDDFMLADEPKLGNWTVEVSVLGQISKYYFQVREFVHPKFDVSVKVPNYLSLTDQNMSVDIRASYTHGRPVKGEVTLQITPRYKYEYLQAPYDKPISIVKDMRGDINMQLSLVDDLQLRGDFARVLEVTAYVREELTDRVQNATSFTTVYRFPYTMQFIRSSDTFKPGLAYTAYLRVANLDGSPVSSGDVTVRHAFVRDPSAFIETKHQLSRSGLVTISVNPPLTDAYTLAFEASYLNLTQWLGEVPRAHSPSNTYLQITLLTETPLVGAEIVVGLNSTRKMVYFVYELYARGDLLYGTTLQAHEGSTHSFRFIAQPSMFPNVRLLIYWIDESGEVVVDSLNIPVKKTSRNTVSLSITPTLLDARGDRKVTVTVSARPNSLIGLTAIDKNTLSVIGEEYRIDQFDIMRELESFDPGQTWLGANADILVVDGDHGNHLVSRRVRRALRPELNIYASSSAAEVFDNSGVLVMTNADIHRLDPLTPGDFPAGPGPINSRGWDPRSLPAAKNGPFGRLPYSSQGSTVRPDLGPGLEYNAPTRPPLAGPYAFSTLPPPPDNRPRLYLSQPLQPTWLFEHRTTSLNGIVSWQLEVPYLLRNTDYVITAFAIDDFTGLNMASQKIDVSTFRSLDVSVQVPSSVILGEALAIEIVVHSGRASTATIALDNSKRDFVFPDFGEDNSIDTASPSSTITRSLEITNGDTTLSIMVIPVVKGKLNIAVEVDADGQRVNASTVLNVNLEGHPITVTKSLYVDPFKTEEISTVLNITKPRNTVQGSLSIEVAACGNSLCNLLSNPVEPLIELPAKSGEQIASRVVPMIEALQYLESVRDLSEKMKETLSSKLELYLQIILRHRRADGSYTEFAEYREPEKPSLWLTAFMAKTLSSMAPYVPIPSEAITKGLSYIVSKQKADGSFTEEISQSNDIVKLSNETDDTPPNLTSRRHSPVALTAYVLLAILSVEDYTSVDVRNAGNRALEYLVSVLQQQRSQEDGYALSMATYAMHLADHPYKETAFYMMEASSISKDGMKWWGTSNNKSHTMNSLEDESVVSSMAIEQTAYCLLTYVQRSLAKESGPIAAWLNMHRNERGGFTTSQDTTVGIQALKALAQLYFPSSGTTTFQVVYGGRGQRFTVNSNNADGVQRMTLPEDTESLIISASGTHPGLLTLSYTYNIRVSAPRPAFSLDPQLDRTTDTSKLRLTACTGLLTSGNYTDERSNMAVMEVYLPSGYVVDDADLPGLYDYPLVRRVGRIGGGSGAPQGVVLFFEYLTAVEVCPTIIASRTTRVARQKPAMVKVYDYYDLTRQARQWYSSLAATLCDICDVGECDQSACSRQLSELSRQRQDPDDDGYPATVEETGRAGGAVAAPGTAVLVGVILSNVAILLLSR